MSMKNDVFWNVTLCGSYVVLTRATQRNISEDTILRVNIPYDSYSGDPRFKPRNSTSYYTMSVTSLDIHNLLSVIKLLVNTDVSEERIASIISVRRISDLETSNFSTVPMSSETSVLTRATRRNIPEDDILHSHCRQNLKSYIVLTGWTL
jgi:hypothetical protein